MKDENKTTMNVYKKDVEWLKRVKSKMKKSAIEDVLHSMINLIKFQKSEGELR